MALLSENNLFLAGSLNKLFLLVLEVGYETKVLHVYWFNYSNRVENVTKEKVHILWYGHIGLTLSILEVIVFAFATASVQSEHDLHSSLISQ